MQHASDQLFQSQCLELLECAVANQEASFIDFAYLKDRLSVLRVKADGTQLNEDLTFYPIEDEHVKRKKISYRVSFNRRIF